MADGGTPKRGRGRPKSAWSDGQTTTVQALDRGLTVLDALARQQTATLTELALTVGMPPSTAHRILATLEKHGFVAFDEVSQAWSIGLQAFRVGSSFAQRSNLIDTGRRTIRQLMLDTGETANLGVADLDEVMLVAQEETSNPVRALFRIGTRVPLHSSGIGKAMMALRPRDGVERTLRRTGLTKFTDKTLISPQSLFAELDRISDRSWALDDEERYTGMRCVAVAIRDHLGEPVAGVSVSGPCARFNDADLPGIAAKVQAAAREVERLTGGFTAT